jgi:hypothetical protein
MIILVKWQEHDRQYTIGINKLFELLKIDVSEMEIKLAIKRLLEQEEMTREPTEHK